MFGFGRLGKLGAKDRRPGQLRLRFTGPTLDPRITHTRASTGTYTDSDGVQKVSAYNLLTFSQEYDNAAWIKGALASVTANVVATSAPDGTFTADKLIEDATTAGHLARQNATLAAIGTCTGSVYLKAAERTTAVIYVNNNISTADRGEATFDLVAGTVSGVASAGGFSGTTASIQFVGNGWYRCSVTTTTSVTGAQLRVYINNASYLGDGTSGIYLWGAQFETGSVATPYIPTFAATSGAPRIDYNPATLAWLGQLIEPQVTNLILQSQDFTAVNWPVRGTAVVTPNTTIAPDGTLTADTLTGATDVTFSGNNIDQTVTVTAGTVYSTSIYIKSLGATTAQIRFRDSTGVGTSSVILTPTSSWQRLELPNVTASVGSTSARIIIGGANGALAIWGGQCELGAVTTSYIPTVASQVTRAADVPLMTGTNFSSWYNQTEGTFVADFIQQSISTTFTGYVVQASGATVNEEVAIYRRASDATIRGVVQTGGVTQAFISAGVSAPTRVKVALAYKANDFAISKDGGVAVVDTAGTVPTPDRLYIGSSVAAGASWLNGHIRSITYYNTRLPNSTLQGLSAL